MSDNSSKTAQVIKEYRWQDFEKDVLVQAIAKQFTFFDDETCEFSASVEEEGPPRITYNYSSLDEWASSFEKSVPISRLSCYDWESNRDISIRFLPQDKRLTLRIRVPFHELESAKDRFMQFESSLALNSYEEEVVPVRSPASTRRYFAAESIDREWFCSAFTTVQEHFSEKIHFTGRSEDVTGGESEISGDDLSSWIDSVAARWDKLDRFYCWLYNPACQITVDCDMRRELLDITVEKASLTEIDTVFHELEVAMKLDRIVEDDPYRYRGIQGQYKILPPFKKKEFATALQVAIDEYIGSRPVVLEAYVESLGDDKSDAAWPLTGFTDCDSYLARLEDDAPYVRAILSVHGPRGAALGVFVEDKLERLVINSHLGKNEFEQLFRIFDQAMRLKPLVEDDNDTSETRKKNIAESVWFKAGLPILTLVIGAVLSFVLTPAFLGATAPAYDVEITLPAHQEDATLKLPAGDDISEIELEWRLESSQMFRVTNDLEVPATIRVFRNGVEEIIRLDGEYPGVRISLSPGIYVVEVFMEDIATSDRFEVLIEETDN